MNVFQAIVLAIIEGLTEFLPVSSTGHMIIGSSVMGIASHEFTKVFTVAIQFGTILSVVALYWKRFFQSFNFYLKLLAGFLPAAVIGLLLSDWIDLLLENVIVVAAMLLLGGIVFLLLDKWFERSENNPDKELSYADAFGIGLFQCIAMIPGVSRSASTIIGGLVRKLNKKQAAEFSFFLAVPTMFAATCKKLYDFHQLGFDFTGEYLRLLVIGNIVGFFVAILAIRSFISYLTKHGFRIFGYYRIAVGLLILGLYLAGVDLQII